MKSKYFLPFILLIMLSCQSEAEKLKAEGYQVFEGYKVAVKCPCELKRDKEQEKEYQKFKTLKIYSCYDIKIKNTKLGGQKYVLQMIKNDTTYKESESEFEIDQLIHSTREDYIYSEKNRIQNYWGVFFKYNDNAWNQIIFTPDYSYHLIMLGDHKEIPFNKYRNSVRILE